MENNAIILDYLPLGHPKSKKNKPIAQAIGTDYFTLLELIPKKGVDLKINETVYIGKGKRDKIFRVLGKLNGENLTKTSRIESDYAIKDIVNANEQKYVTFFNTAGGITLTLHQLGLLPGINSTMVNKLLKERKIKKFDSFEDIKERVPSVKNPQNKIAEKIKEELGIIPLKKRHMFRLFTEAPNKKSKKEYVQ